MSARKPTGEGFYLYTIRLPEEWKPIFKKAIKLSGYTSINAFLLATAARTPEVIKAWELAGKPVLPPLVRSQGNPAFIKKKRPTAEPTRGLWGRPTGSEDGDGDTG